MSPGTAGRPAPVPAAVGTGSGEPVASPDALWRQRLGEDPTASALDDGRAAWSRAEVEAVIQAQVRALQAQDVRPTDIVAWLGANSVAMLATLLACERLGAVFMPLNWRLSPAELVTQLQHAGTAVLLADDEFPALAAAVRDGWATASAPERGSAQVGDLLLVYTSGTTGEPKGAMHTAAQVTANAQAAIAVQGLGRGTRALAVLPMFHVGGLCIQLLPTLLSGGVARLHARFDAAAWLQDVERWSPTTSVLVPATMRAVMDHPDWSTADLRSLQVLYTGSSVVPVALIERFHARGVPVAQVYGSTETGPFSVALSPDEALANPGSTGREAPGVQIRLVQSEGNDAPTGGVGDIWVRGDNVMRGYHRMPDHPDFQDGWFRSGDLGRRRADGHVEVVGRSKDMIISGGENIYPAEIENLVIAVPGVAECAVVGVPDERWGEAPVLALVAQAGQTLNLQTVRQAYETRLARFKHPRRVLVLQALPKTALGKVQKSQLVDQLRQGPPAGEPGSVPAGV